MPSQRKRRIVSASFPGLRDSFDIGVNPVFKCNHCIFRIRRNDRCGGRFLFARKVCFADPVDSLLPVANLIHPGVDIACDRPEPFRIIDLNLAFRVLVSASGTQRLAAPRYDLDAGLTWRDFRKSNAVQPAQNWQCPGLDSVVINAVVKIYAGPRIGDFKRQPRIELACI